VYVTIKRSDPKFGSEWHVWISSEPGEPTSNELSFIIGTGPTPREAAEDARADLSGAIAQLPGLLSGQPCGCDLGANHLCETHA
jgi:hypothetical protein